MKVIFIPMYFTDEELREKNIVLDATVEAEYGEKVIEGKSITLAHHSPKYSHCPAPCCADVMALKKDAVIGISHIDLDTVGGCLALMGNKTENEKFWRGAGFIDCHGIHHIHELEEEIQRKLNAVYAWNEGHRFKGSTEICDVTEIVLEFGETVKKIIDGNEELLENGDVWVAKMEKQTESCLVWEDGNVRIFEIPDFTFCSAAYYSPTFQKTAKATLAYSDPKKSITLAFEDGGKEYSAREIVQELFGELAGGHPGIAGSPRSQEMTGDDWERAKEKIKGLYKI